MTPAAYISQQRSHRRARLSKLISIHGGAAGVFAARFGYTEAQISQYLSSTYRGGNSLGERAARALEDVVGVRFGWLDEPEVEVAPHASAYHAAKLRAAIADARHVFEGQKVAEDVLHYLEQVLAAGAPVPAETGIAPGAENASIAKETYTPLREVFGRPLLPLGDRG